jgi:hypothetical protein
MVMCASGSLGIISAPQAGCSSISQAVDGNVTPPKSLTTLSVAAGKTAPHAMTEFYGYGGTIPVKLGLVSQSSTSSSCCVLTKVSGITSSSTAVSLCYCIDKSAGALTSSSCIILRCNSTTLCTISMNLVAACVCTGLFSTITVTNTDVVDVCLVARVNNPSNDITMSTTAILSVGSGFSIGSPSIRTATAGAPV